MSDYKNIYSITQITSYIKNMFDQDYMLSKVAIRGEVGSVTYHSSGYIYFSLKDANTVINCMMDRLDQRQGLAFKLETGQKVIAAGRVSVYPKQGKYQFYAKSLKKDGIGDLNAAFLELKQRLEEKGMFAEEYKQKIPRHVRTLGVVTSPTGAAIRDILDVARRRNPYLQILLYPATVQGETAPPTIIRGIRAMEAYGVDLIIVGRGGGSKEDLWCFNDEDLAQAIFDCSVPIISGVGHEIDFTISDFVADLRAPTPSAAAELAVSDIRGDLERLEGAARRLDVAMRNHAVRERLRLRELGARLDKLSPQARLRDDRARAGRMKERMEGLMDNRLKTEKQRLASLPGQLDLLMDRKLQRRKHVFELLLHRFEGRSPLKRLGGGYVYATDEQGKALGSVRQIKTGDAVRLLLKDGRALARIESVEEEAVFAAEEDRKHGG
ncbi:MAG: exodeoxyribonuclease VII large subunit [Lachnospiraceae bacterium]|nr:exodeoxyribonuclease VII large subunit [Lachnospiraceae bacterium]